MALIRRRDSLEDHASGCGFGDRLLRGKAKGRTEGDLGKSKLAGRGKAVKTTAQLSQVGEKIKDAFKH